MLNRFEMWKGTIRGYPGVPDWSIEGIVSLPLIPYHWRSRRCWMGIDVQRRSNQEYRIPLLGYAIRRILPPLFCL